MYILLVLSYNRGVLISVRYICMQNPWAEKLEGSATEESSRFIHRRAAILPRHLGQALLI